MVVALTFTFLTLPSVAGAGEFRAGTSTEGKKLEAEFISATTTKVTLRRKSDGKKIYRVHRQVL